MTFEKLAEEFSVTFLIMSSVLMAVSWLVCSFVIRRMVSSLIMCLPTNGDKKKDCLSTGVNLTLETCIYLISDYYMNISKPLNKLFTF